MGPTPTPETIRWLRDRAKTDPEFWFHTVTGLGRGPKWHTDVFKWAAALPGRTKAPDPLIVPAHRGASKSTIAETVAAWAVSTGTEPFVLYVRPTLELANRHIGSIGALLQTTTAVDLNPELHVETVVVRDRDERLGDANRSRTWNVSMLQGNGWTIAAVGALQGLRGMRSGMSRPTLIIIDDIDSQKFSPHRTETILGIVTDEVIPAGDLNTRAVLFMGNTPTRYSIMFRTIGNKLDFLNNGVVSGPHKAVDGPIVADRQHVEGFTRPQWVIDWEQSGQPAWDGFGREAVTAVLNETGLASFKREFQFEFDDTDKPVPWYVDYADTAPDGTVWVRAFDLATTTEDAIVSWSSGADWTVSVKVGKAPDGRIVLADPWCCRLSPTERNLVFEDIAATDPPGVRWVFPKDPVHGREVVEQLVARFSKQHQHPTKPGVMIPKRTVAGRRIVGSKAERAKVLEDQFQAGITRDRQVLIVGESPWWALFEQQFDAFGSTVTEHDDCVDAVADGWAELTQTRPVQRSPRAVTRTPSI